MHGVCARSLLEPIYNDTKKSIGILIRGIGSSSPIRYADHVVRGTLDISFSALLIARSIRSLFGSGVSQHPRPQGHLSNDTRIGVLQEATRADTPLSAASRKMVTPASALSY